MIGGNINGILQLKSKSKNAVGEAVTSYTDTVVLKGFLDLMSGDVRRIVYSAKVQESTHIFICDYVNLPQYNIIPENCRMLVNGIVIMMKLGKILIKNVSKAKNEICEFLAGCTEFDNGTQTAAKDFSQMKIVPFVKLIKEFSKREDLTDFFGEVAAFQGTARKDLRNSSTEDTETLTDISTEQ